MREISKIVGIVGEAVLKALDDAGYVIVPKTVAELRLREPSVRQCCRPGCNEVFNFGASTGRRSTSLYCSPKCQKADAYQKSKAAA